MDINSVQIPPLIIPTLQTTAHLKLQTQNGTATQEP